MNRFDFFQRWLLFASVFAALQGLTWIIFGSFDPLGIYNDLLATALFGTDELTVEAATAFGYGAALLGATNAGFFVLFGFITHYPFANRELWAYRALVTGLLTWFVLDTIFSWQVGATFNIVIVNLPCLILFGIPLTITRRDFYLNP